MPDLGLYSLFLALSLTAGNEGVVTLTRPAAPPAPGTRHYVVQVRILEVDEQGRATVIATPTVQTTGAAAGVTIDGERGRRFEFHFSASMDGAPSPLPVVIGDDVVPKPIAVTASNTIETDRVLEQKVSVRAVQQPRKDVLRDVARQAGLTVALASDTAANAASQLAAPITYQADNAPLDDVLKQLVEPLKLGYSVRHGLVLIGFDAPAAPVPPQRVNGAAGTPAADAWHVRVYDVAGLVSPDPATDRPDFQPLLKRLQAEVLPKSWDAAGGEATVRGFHSTVSLVVRQTPAGHDAVADFLAALRKEKLPKE